MEGFPEEDFSRGGFSVFSQCVKDAVPELLPECLCHPEYLSSGGLLEAGEPDSRKTPIPFLCWPPDMTSSEKNIARVQNCPDITIIISNFGLCLFVFSD